MLFTSHIPDTATAATIAALLEEIRDNTAAYDAGELVVESKTETANFTIPAGAREVSIVNAGAESVTVNGQPLAVGQSARFEQREDPATREILKVPIITVTVSGPAVWYTVVR